MGLSIDQVKEQVAAAEASFRHPECASCECYLGFLAQLAIDTNPGGQACLKEHQPPRDQVHGCLGCEPCPPGTLYGEYLRKQAQQIKDRNHGSSSNSPFPSRKEDCC